MPNDDSELSISQPLIDADSEPEKQVAAPEELVNKILALRAKGDAKNNPKKPKSAAAPRPTRVVAPRSETIPLAATEIFAPTTESVLRPEPKLAEDFAEIAAPIQEKLEGISVGIGQLSDLFAAAQEQVSEQNCARDKAFDLLYEEMNGYKNDFFYERLKPTLRSLLFLLDSIEEFEREVKEHEKVGDTTPSEIIRANLAHFRDQLTDALFMSEMAPIEAPDEIFDAKTQRAVQVVKVEPAQNNTVQRQIRGGWTLGGKMLRPADVVVGKSN